MPASFRPIQGAIWVLLLSASSVRGATVQFRNPTNTPFPYISSGQCTEEPAGPFPKDDPLKPDERPSKDFGCRIVLQLHWDVAFKITTKLRIVKGSPYVFFSLGFATSVMPIRDREVQEQLAERFGAFSNIDIGAVLGDNRPEVYGSVTLYPLQMSLPGNFKTDDEPLELGTYMYHELHQVCFSNLPTKTAVAAAYSKVLKEVMKSLGSEICFSFFDWKFSNAGVSFGVTASADLLEPTFIRADPLLSFPACADVHGLDDIKPLLRTAFKGAVPANCTEYSPLQPMADCTKMAIKVSMPKAAATLATAATADFVLDAAKDRFVLGTVDDTAGPQWPTMDKLATAAARPLPKNDCGSVDFFQPFDEVPKLGYGTMCKASAGGPPKEVLCKFKLVVSNMSDSELGEYEMSFDLKLLLNPNSKLMAGSIGFSTPPILSTNRLSEADSLSLAEALKGMNVGQLIGGCSLSDCLNLFPYRVSFPPGYDQTAEVVEMFAFETLAQVEEGICMSALGDGLSASTNVKAGAFVAVALEQLGIDICFRFPKFVNFVQAATDANQNKQVWDSQFGIRIEASFMDNKGVNMDKLLALMSLATKEEERRLYGLAPALTQVLRGSLLPYALRMNVDVGALAWHYSRSAEFIRDNLFKVKRTCEPLLCDLYTTREIEDRSPPATGENKICRDDSRPDVSEWQQCTASCATQLYGQLFPTKPDGTQDLEKGCCFSRLNTRLMEKFKTKFERMIELCAKVNSLVKEPCTILNTKTYTAYPTFAPTDFNLNLSLTPLLVPAPLLSRSKIQLELLCTPFAIDQLRVIRSALASSAAVSTERILLLDAAIPTANRPTVIVNFTVGDKGESTYEAAAPTVLQSLTLMYNGGTLQLPCPVRSLQHIYTCAVCGNNETCQASTGLCLVRPAAVSAASALASHVLMLVLAVLVPTLLWSR